MVINLRNVQSKLLALFVSQNKLELQDKPEIVWTVELVLHIFEIIY